MNLKSGVSGDKLAARVHAARESRPPLIEGLIHEKSVILNSSDPGSGKSVITACMMAQSSLGLPVFGQLYVPRPLFHYYIPFERGAQEIEERFKHIEAVIPINYDNINVNENFMGMNVNNEKHAEDIITNIKADVERIGKPIDVLYLDPIISAVAGGLGNEEKASLFTRFSTRLQVEFNCAIWMNHHTTKETYSSDGGKIEKDDPFYGSQYLKAHCTGGFYMRRGQRDKGPTLFNKKDSHSCLLPQISLTYDPDTYTVFMDGMDHAIPVKDRLLMVYRTFKAVNKTVTFREIQGCLGGVSDSHLRNMLRTPPFNMAFKKISTNGSNTLYKPEVEI